MPALSFLRAGLEPFPGYRLTHCLGSGAYGEVWAAQIGHGRLLALKFLPCDSGLSAAREIRSLQAIRQLEHPNLIRMEHIWCYQTCVVVAMEMAEGSLWDLAESYHANLGTPVVPEHACLLFCEAADALDYLNARNHWINGRCVAIQHCDIKPANLLVLDDSIKVCDFGLATLMATELETRHRAGTPDYAAPEVFHGHVSNHTDQYALAVSFCLIRGGRLPFSDTPPSFDARYVRPRPDLSMLTLAERPLIARALDPVPQNRWPTCKALFDRISRLFCEVDPRTGKTKSGRISKAIS
jgi:serine/threonine-protein kinase